MEVTTVKKNSMGGIRQVMQSGTAKQRIQERKKNCITNEWKSK